MACMAFALLFAGKSIIPPPSRQAAISGRLTAIVANLSARPGRRFSAIIGQGEDGMEFSVLATGYCFLEAPRVAGEHVWFTDLLVGGVHRLSLDGSVDTFLPERHHVGGLAVNFD